MKEFAQGWLNTAMLERHEEITNAANSEAASYVNEAVDAIRTVAALGRERETMRLLKARFQVNKTRKRFLFLGIAGFALSYGMVMWIAGLIFYRGSQRLASGMVSMKMHREPATSQQADTGDSYRT